MRQVQEKRGGNRLRMLAVPVVVGTLVYSVVSVLWAEPPDSVKPGLQEGTFVPRYRDTTTRKRSPVALAALERLNANSPKRWSVNWNKYTGVPETMGGSTNKKYPGDAAEAAAAFAEEYKELFFGFDDGQPIDNYSLKEDRIIPDKTYTSVVFRECYKGVSVYQASLAVWVSTEGRIIDVSNRMRITQLDNVSPSLTRAKADEIIRNAAAPDSVGQEGPELELCIYPSSPPRLAYSGFKVIRGATIGFVVDAHTGEFISVRPLHVCDWPGVRRMAIPDSIKAKQTVPEGKIQAPQQLGPVFQLPADGTGDVDDRKKPDNPRAPDAANRAKELLRKQAQPRIPPEVPRRQDSTAPQSDGWPMSTETGLTARTLSCGRYMSADITIRHWGSPPASMSVTNWEPTCTLERQTRFIWKPVRMYGKGLYCFPPDPTVYMIFRSS